MNIGRRLLTGTAAAAALALGLGSLSACSAAAGAADGPPGRFDVVASFYPMAYLAEQIGGAHVHVTTLTEPGQEPHDLEISARQAARMEESDAVLYLKGLQPSIDDAVAQSGIRTKIDAASLTTLENHGTEVGGHAAAHDTAPDEETGGRDPHVWLDPLRYAQIARGVGAALAKADPAHAADYRTRTAALVKRLDDLDARYRTGLRHTRSKVFITTHAAFGYLAERYGLTEEAVNGLDPESEPSVARVRELESMAEADGVTTVFHETLLSDRTARTVARDTHLHTDVLDPLEGITAHSRGRDYIQVMDANLQALRKALGTS
ncbi:metal ABC transporter substrate-binding protein [Streptomyces tropicalis]|uniref:Metal ABC transporter substrate-binding protein n=1 Tax=Streptomyces tropicalis TaxID=3034234 RepID=A0ABT5ZYH0_9ACTN|nr:metal ABC transporter substrate-binding protein [Streptomyces tropicalis]MDF3297413.1 metal ABC transporter substrate-binding protein [Streptomyces tropicalis]